MEENDGERASERVRELLIFSCCCWYDFASEHINRFTIFIAHCKNRVRETKKNYFYICIAQRDNCLIHIFVAVVFVAIFLFAFALVHTGRQLTRS